MTDIPAPPTVSADEHQAHGLEVPNLHFNVLKIVEQAKRDFLQKTAGKVAKYFYAPEPFLYLIDYAVKQHIVHTQEVSAEILRDSRIVQVFGMELIAIEGTCITVTAEKIHEDESEALTVVAGNDSVN